MTTDNIQEKTIPAAPTYQDEMAYFRRVIDGYTDDKNEHHPGVVAMLKELYEDYKKQKERREALNRALTSGSLLAGLGVCLAWLKDHIK